VVVVPQWLIQLTALAVLVIPLVAIQWDVLGKPKRRAGLLSRLGDVVAPKEQQRWRLEIYSNDDDVEGAVVDRDDIPFPVKQVQSARGELARKEAMRSWSLPQVELEVVVDDPFTDEVLTGLFGVDHNVRFITGNEAMIDARGDRRLRVRALPFR
jgi:hypothetical protein